MEEGLGGIHRRFGIMHPGHNAGALYSAGNDHWKPYIRLSLLLLHAGLGAPFLGNVLCPRAFRVVSQTNCLPTWPYEVRHPDFHE